MYSDNEADWEGMYGNEGDWETEGAAIFGDEFPEAGLWEEPTKNANMTIRYYADSLRCQQASPRRFVRYLNHYLIPGNFTVAQQKEKVLPKMDMVLAAMDLKKQGQCNTTSPIYKEIQEIKEDMESLEIGGPKPQNGGKGPRRDVKGSLKSEIADLPADITSEDLMNDAGFVDSAQSGIAEAIEVAPDAITIDGFEITKVSRSRRSRSLRSRRAQETKTTMEVKTDFTVKAENDADAAAMENKLSSPAMQTKIQEKTNDYLEKAEFTSAQLQGKKPQMQTNAPVGNGPQNTGAAGNGPFTTGPAGSAPQSQNGPQNNGSQGQGNGPQSNGPQGQGNGPQNNGPQGQGNGPQSNVPQGQGNGPQSNGPQNQGTGPQNNGPQGQGHGPQSNGPQGQGNGPQTNQPQGQGNGPQGQGNGPQGNGPADQGDGIAVQPDSLNSQPLNGQNQQQQTFPVGEQTTTSGASSVLASVSTMMIAIVATLYVLF